MNRWIGIGRLTADPQLRYTPNGNAVCTFTLAVDRRYVKEGQQKTDFVQIVVWGKQGEACANYLHKGSAAAVDGELHIRSYEVEGQKKWATEVLAENVKFLSPKSAASSIGTEVDEPAPF